MGSFTWKGIASWWTNQERLLGPEHLSSLGILMNVSVRVQLGRQKHEVAWNKGLDLTQSRELRWRHLSRASGHEENLDVKPGRARWSRIHQHKLEACLQLNQRSWCPLPPWRFTGPGFRGPEGVAGLATDSKPTRVAYVCNVVVTGTFADLQSKAAASLFQKLPQIYIDWPN